jgi:ABC-type thiamin/hydroxymethylpyrimidine transport system permease subunit
VLATALDNVIAKPDRKIGGRYWCVASFVCPVMVQKTSATALGTLLPSIDKVIP